MNEDPMIITRTADKRSFSVAQVPSEKLLEKQINLLFAHTPKAVASAYVVAVISVAVFWDIISHSQLFSWLLAITLLTGARIFVAVSQTFKEHSPGTLKHRLYLNNLGILLSAVLWGLAAIQYNLDWPLENQVFLFFALAGISAGAIPSYAVLYKSYLLFLLPVALPVSVSLMLVGSKAHVSMGLLVLFYALAMAVFAALHSRSLRQSHVLGFENQRLIAGLSTSNDNLRQEVIKKQSAMEQLRREQRLFYEGPVVTYRFRKVSGWPIEYISRTVRQFGLDPDQLMRDGFEYKSLIHPDDLEKLDKASYCQEDDSDLFVLEIDYRLLLPDGQVRWIYDFSMIVTDEQDGEEYYDGYLIDITSRKQMEQALIEEKERVQVTLESIGDGVITTDSQDNIRFMNPVAEHLTGWTLEEARGKPVNEVFMLADELESKNYRNDRRRHASGSFWNALGDHKLLCRKGGESFYGKSVKSAITGADGENHGSVIVFHDVSEQRKLTEHLSYQARHDPLTGLINRREFEWAVDKALTAAKEQNIVHSLCYIDLDQFKIVNDTCGHDAGDELLKQLAYGISQALRETDMLSRLGGDEFGLLLEACSEQNAYTIAEKIRKYIKDNRFVWDQKVFEVGASIGIVEITAESESVGKLLSAADIACYAAKDKGRNQVHIYQGQESEAGKRHSEIQLVSQINHALEENSLLLYFQPIKNLHNPEQDHLTSGEILARMLSENGEIVSPGLFIPAAERYNIMPAIDIWVIKNTLAWCENMLEMKHSIGRLSINLSGYSLGSQNFCSDVINLFEQYDVSPENICFDITETAAISNFTSASQFIKRLRERGCQFALDDFGSGLSSFSYLKNLAVDYLKIDGCFIKDIVDDEIDREMVKSIHQLGKMMGMKTIAEFVENDAILAEINAIGIDYAQGYGIARPIPLDQVFGNHSDQVQKKETCALT